MKILIPILLLISVTCTRQAKGKVDVKIRQAVSKIWENMALALAYRHHYYMQFLDVLENAVPKEAEHLISNSSRLREDYILLSVLLDNIVENMRGHTMAQPQKHIKMDVLEARKSRAFKFQDQEQLLNYAIGVLYRKRVKEAKDKPLLLFNVKNETTENENKDFRQFLTLVKNLTEVESVFGKVRQRLADPQFKSSFLKGSNMSDNDINEFLGRVASIKEIVDRLHETTLPQLENARKYVVDKNVMHAVVLPVTVLLERRLHLN